MKFRFTAAVVSLAVAASLALSTSAMARRHPEPQVVLTATGKKLMAHYQAILGHIRHEISRAVPHVDPGMVHPFMMQYRAIGTKRPYITSNHAFVKAISECQQTAAPILSMVNPFLSSDRYDQQLAEASVIADATPRGLAAFAQKSKSNEELINSLLANKALMKQMQDAGGPLNGNYGLAMKIYNTIERTSPESHHGVLQRMAVAMALVQKPARAKTSFNPVRRYFNLQRAYLKGELNPAFPTFTTWQLKFVVNDSYSNKDISWFRHMLMNYEPGYVLSGHYLNIVHTDVGYNDMHYGCVPGNKPSQLIAGGGECGARAWIARMAERGFGIPTWGVKQRGHAALSIWTRKEWVTRFAAGWEWVWWTHHNGLNFYQESQARRYPEKFPRVLRAEWIGATLGETKEDPRKFGTGGFWYAIADSEERAILASGKPTYVTPSDAELARLNGPTLAQKLESARIPMSAMRISVNSNGVITIPAVAYLKPHKQVAGVVPMKSFSGGMQIYYQCAQPAFKRHNPFEYAVNVPRGGKYELTMKYVSIKPDQLLNLSINGGSDPVVMNVPWTNGNWAVTQPVTVMLKRGANTLTFERGKMTGFKAKGIYALSIKKFVLTPAGHS